MTGFDDFDNLSQKIPLILAILIFISSAQLS